MGCVGETGSYILQALSPGAAIRLVLYIPFQELFTFVLTPFEQSLDASGYGRFLADQLWLFIPMQQVVGQFLGTFREYPPRQPTASFTIDKALQRMQAAVNSASPK